MEWQYGDETIEITGMGMFLVASDHITFESIAQARAYVGRKTVAAAKTKKRTLALAVLDQDGNRGTVTGLHRGTARLTGQGFDPNTYGLRLYVDAPVVVELLAERDRLTALLDSANDRLDTFAVPVRGSGYSGTIQPENYDTEVGYLVAAHEAASKAAQAATQ